MINITQPFLPPFDEYQNYLSKVWENNWLTNCGPLVNELESKLKEHLEVKNLLFVTNGTIALQMAIKALELKGEIITTPFSFVATTSSIVWEGCTPVFVDIDPESLNIDASKIEASITENTSAILATHVYGNPCDVVKIEEIAKKYNLKVIYDGAHAFGIKVNGKSIFEYGDISTCSLHATKLYHSCEGGFIVTKDLTINNKLYYSRNFGFKGPEEFENLGINGKNSELHAAMGLANYKYIQAIHTQRKILTETYNSSLKTLPLSTPKWHDNSTKNYAYYPVIFEDEKVLLQCMDALKKNEIHTRRYFYPSLSTSLPYVDHNLLTITDSFSKRVLCLPLYFDLKDSEIKLICKIISETINKQL